MPLAKPRSKPPEPLRIGFTFNVKRQGSHGDADAEYDSPATIEAITTAPRIDGPCRRAARSQPRAAIEADGVQRSTGLQHRRGGLSGRNREAQVPALCELCAIPYTGSDSATLALALDKALTKRLLRQHDILTPEFQVMTSGREKLSTKLRYPLIVARR